MLARVKSWVVVEDNGDIFVNVGFWFGPKSINVKDDDIDTKHLWTKGPMNSVEEAELYLKNDIRNSIKDFLLELSTNGGKIHSVGLGIGKWHTIKDERDA